MDKTYKEVYDLDEKQEAYAEDLKTSEEKRKELEDFKAIYQ